MNDTSDCPYYQIRAIYDERVIRVYQAYSDEIADTALAHGTFVSPPFKTTRMTWIKPSFLWMMYRSGWGYKDRNQSRILAIDITREGFEWAIEKSFGNVRDGPSIVRERLQIKEGLPVIVQWDPERDILSEAQPYRSIQIGLGKAVIPLYINEWIQKITEVTDVAHAIHSSILDADLERARAMLPSEKPYPYNTGYWLKQAASIRQAGQRS